MKAPTEWGLTPPYADLLGLHVRSAADGRSEVELRYRPEVANRKGDVHGGAMASLLDMAMSQAIRGAAEVKGLSTISLAVNFIGNESGDLVGRGRMERCGGSVAFASGEVLGASGTLLATAQASFRIFR